MKITMLRIRSHTLKFQIVSKRTHLGHYPWLTNSTTWKTLMIKALLPLAKDTQNSISKLLENYVPMTSFYTVRIYYMWVLEYKVYPCSYTVMETVFYDSAFTVKSFSTVAMVIQLL